MKKYFRFSIYLIAMFGFCGHAGASNVPTEVAQLKGTYIRVVTENNSRDIKSIKCKAKLSTAPDTAYLEHTASGTFTSVTDAEAALQVVLNAFYGARVELKRQANIYEYTGWELDGQRNVKVGKDSTEKYAEWVAINSSARVVKVDPAIPCDVIDPGQVDDITPWAPDPPDTNRARNITKYYKFSALITYTQ